MAEKTDELFFHSTPKPDACKHDFQGSVMFGRTVKIDSLNVFVTCSPSTPLSQVLEQAARQVEKWEREADHKQHAMSIAFRHGITVQAQS